MPDERDQAPTTTLWGVVSTLGAALGWGLLVGVISHWNPWVVAGAMFLGSIAVISAIAAWQDHPRWARAGRLVAAVMTAALIAAYIRETQAQIDGLRVQI